MIIDEYLAAENMTATEFARRVGVSRQMVYQWISGRRPIAAEQAIPIEVATGGKIPRHKARPDIYPFEESASP